MSPSSLSTSIQFLVKKTGWYRMARREKLLVGSLGVLACSILFFQFLFSPLLDSRQRLQRSLVKKKVELQEIRSLQKEYQALQLQTGDIQERLTKRPKSFTLFSFIEQQAAAARIKQQISYLKPSEVEIDGPLHESRVDMKLQRISLDDLVAFLKGIESSENVVFINRISIQEHGKDQGYLNSVIQVITFRTIDT